MSGVFYFCRSRGLCGSSGSGSRAGGVNHRHHRLNRHRLPFVELNFFQHAGGGRGNFGVHFIRGNFEQRLVALDFVAGLFQPLGDGAFENAFAHLGHDDVNGHTFLLFLLFTG